MRPGPLRGSRPRAKTAGKMASPARSPAPVSPRTVKTAFDPRASSSFRYDPYTTMKVPPRANEKTT